MLQKPQAYDRTCGSCTACCKTYSIAEIAKEAQTWCPDCAIGKGCRRYETRPAICREFWCLWLNGYGENDDCPDKLGVVQSIDIGALTPSNGITFMEFLPDALQKPRVIERTKELVGDGIIVYHVPISGRQRVFMPANKTTANLSVEYLAKQDPEIIQAVNSLE